METGYSARPEQQPAVLDNASAGAPDYHQVSAQPKAVETHGGQDVPLYADGPDAHLFRGVMEQNVIFHVMIDALGLADRATGPRRASP